MRMKKLVVTMSLLVVAAVAFSAVYASAAAGPVNKKCPVKGSMLKDGCPTVDVVCKDKSTATVGTCCNNCMETYKKDFAKYKPDGLKSPVDHLARP
jgi:hypothetical protein